MKLSLLGKNWPAFLASARRARQLPATCNIGSRICNNGLLCCRRSAFSSSSGPSRLSPSARTHLSPTRCAKQVRFPSWTPRSEEHTSELQSHLNLVCRLLLEKKK